MTVLTEFWPNLAVFRNMNPPVSVFVADGRKDIGVGANETSADLEIGSNEMSWRVDVSFDSFGQIRPPEMAEFCVF